MRSLKALIGASVLSLMVVTAPVAMAQGKADRARSAIAAAQAKIDASAQVGAGNAVPAEQARANEALAQAKEMLASGHKDEAIAAANRASALADTALGRTQQTHAAVNAARTDAAAAAVDSARQDAAASQAQAAQAQAQAADANARADAAQQQAAVASADAAAARAAPPPAPAVTAVTTETTKSTNVTPAKRHVVRRVVTTPAKATTTEKTTTTVSTDNQ